MALLESVLIRGTRGDQPAASAVSPAAVYCVTDEGFILEQSDGSSWQSFGSSGRVPNVQTVTSSATVTPTFSNDGVKITAQATGLTLANPTGTAFEMAGMAIRIKDNGTARSISFGSQYRAIDVVLPTTTVIGKTLYIGLIYNIDDTKWDVVAVKLEQ